MDCIELRSDNSAGVAPAIMAALADTNVGSAIAYGDDDVTAQLQTRVREVFEHETARVFPVTSGTGANALSLTAICPPWGSVLCHDTAHIMNSEGGATSMLGGGAVMRGVSGDDFTMSADALAEALAGVRWGDPHHSQASALSFTQPTDMGTIYQLDELTKLSSIAHDSNLRVHLDGARFANALVALHCTPAEMTWRSGVDIVSLGATKNGGLSAEAIVVFDGPAADELVYRTKRSGHVTSKMRFQSAQVLAYLHDDLWLQLASNSNDRMRQLATGLADLGVETVNRVDVNMAFVRFDEPVIQALEAAGLLFYRIGPGLVRFVTSWQTTSDDIARVLDAIRTALA